MKTLREQKRWVVWNFEEVNGRKTKVPYTTTNRHASSTDPKTWTTYDVASKAAQFFDGIGVIFTPDQKLLGIDIDHVLDDDKNIVGEQSDQIKDLIKKCNTYTEYSPSGTGLHLYLFIEEALPLTGGNKSAPWEIYTSGRFFTVTENSYHKKPKEIRTVSLAEATDILAIMGYPWKGIAVDSKESTNLLGDAQSVSYFTDEQLLDRMFASSNGEKVRAVYAGSAEEYGDDLSRADMALLAHLAFWSRCDAPQMERIWLASELGKREKTQKRKDYRARSIDSAIANCKETYTPHGVSEELPLDVLESLDLLYTITEKKDKSYTQNTENMCRILRKHPDFKGRLRYDEFTATFEIQKEGVWMPFDDSDAVDMQTQISILFSFFRKVGKEMVYDAIVKVSKEQAIDSARDFIRGIVWDKTLRLEQWLTKTYGTPDDEYHRAVASNWLKGLVKRIMVPGCKFDYVLVLEGEQGVKKSTSLAVLGTIPGRRDSWHVETTMSTDSKDFFMQFAGKAIIEFSEGETLSRTEVKKMKAIITMQSDKYRPPYGRTSLDFPRRCVFAMTTNQQEYLKDETGNRRWLPITVMLPEADIDWLKLNRDQLFAEAYERVIARGESVHEFPKEATEAAQNARRVGDPNEDRVVDWYFNDQFINTSDGITIQQVYAQALNGFGSMKKYDEMAISDILKRVLKLEKKRKMVGGVQMWRWFPPEERMSFIQPSNLQDETMLVDGEEVDNPFHES